MKPSKEFKEFMEVMKGGDDITAESSALAQGASKKGKEKALQKPLEDEESEPEAEDDDAAWLARRRGALDGDDDEAAVSLRSHVSLY